MHLFQNALSLDPQNVSMLVLVMAAAAWAGMALVLLVDLFGSSRLGLVWKLLWFPIIVCVPVVSGLMYGAFSLIRSLTAARAKS